PDRCPRLVGGSTPAPDRLSESLRENLRRITTRARRAQLQPGWPQGADVATRVSANEPERGAGTLRPWRLPLPADMNPFRIRDTSMQPNVLLIAKLVTIAFLFSGQIVMLSHHFVPFVGFFRHVGSPSAFHLALMLIFLAAAAFLFLNRYLRVACVVLGAVIIV